MSATKIEGGDLSGYPEENSSDIYGYARVVGWESKWYSDLHRLVSAPGSTLLPYEHSPMASPSSLGNPAIFLLYASPFALDSPQAKFIYALDTLSLPWVIQEEVALAILSPTRGEKAMKAMEEAWDNMVAFHGTGNKEWGHVISQLARDIVGGICKGDHADLLATWETYADKMHMHPLKVINLSLQLFLAHNRSPKGFLDVVTPQTDEYYSSILIRSLEIPVAHRLRESTGSALGTNERLIPLYDCPPQILRSIVNTHERFSLNTLEDYIAMVEEYNVEWANAAWQTEENSTLLREMRRLIAEG